MIKKGGSNWVDGENFFDRQGDLEALEERVREGTHTLLTAQRRMGKTSLVRELQRRLAATGEFEIIFADLEAAANPADVIAELGVQTKFIHAAWHRVKTNFANFIYSVGGRIEELSAADLKVKLRAGIDAGNWPQRGDAIFDSLAECGRPVVLAIDELPILVSRLLKGKTGRLTQKGKSDADALLSWLRKMGQSYKGRVTLILSGSVSLEPLLEQAGLSAHANIFSSYQLEPWNEEIAVSCLEALAASYEIDLSLKVRQKMCRKLRCCIPHHVQMFFDRVHEHLRRDGRSEASLKDVERVYLREMLGIRGQVDLQHYEGRLKIVLGETGYTVALEILTAAAVNGRINAEAVNRYRDYFESRDEKDRDDAVSVGHVLHVLQHDGYLEPEDDGYRFVSGLLEEWWCRRYGNRFVPEFDQQR